MTPSRLALRRLALRRLGLTCLALCAALVLAACTPAPPPLTRPAPADIAALAQAIETLSPDILPEEAARAARIAYLHPLELAREYGITDTPVVHNTKVNLGLRPRGLCWHWADDMEARMAREGFATLDLHRAIAEPPIRLDHSTLVISAAGAPMRAGIVIDPWRFGGRLFWAPVAEDTRYDWEERQVVFDRRAGRIEGNAVMPPARP